jgi:hypothetical protein
MISGILFIPLRTLTGTGEIHRRSWWGNPREREHLEDLGLDGRILLKCIFQ